MQKLQKLLLLGVVVSIAMIGSGYAFADTPDSYTAGAQAGLDAGVSLKVSGMSVLPGLLLSLFSVWNKNINGQGQGINGKEVVDPRKLMINIILGVVISVALNIIGMSTDTINANSSFLTSIAVTGVNYMFLHLTNLGLRPLFGHLVSFLGSYAKATGKTG